MVMTPSNGTSGAMGVGDTNMGSMPKNPPSGAPMPGSGMSGMMAMMGQMMGMGGMSPAPGAAMSGMPQSALPGFPGVSHLYHIGATGFFLDHSDHIRLSNEQQMSLNTIKEKAVAAKSTTDAQIERAKQDSLAVLIAVGDGFDDKETTEKVGFALGRGVHDIHMMQGNRGDFARDNRIDGDGALFIRTEKNLYRIEAR